MSILSGFVTLSTNTILVLILIVKLIFLWYSSHKRYFVTEVVKSGWDNYQEAHAKPSNPSNMQNFENESSDLYVKLHNDPMRIFVIIPSSLASTKGSFVPTFGLSSDSETLDALGTDGNAHVIVVKPIGRKEKVSAYGQKILVGFDKAQELSSSGTRFLPITILAEEIGSNLLLQAISTLPTGFLENLIDSIVLYNPVLDDLKGEPNAVRTPLAMSQQTIVNTFRARFKKVMGMDVFGTVQQLKLPVLLLTNNVYEEVHGISFRNAGEHFFEANRAENLHRVHIDTESISTLLENSTDDVDMEFDIVVNTWNEIVVQKIVQFVEYTEGNFTEKKV